MVRQLIDLGGFWNLDKALRGQFKTIKNLQYIGAMNQPGGGRNDIPNRLKRQFMIFNMILPQDIEIIYGPIIKHSFKPSKYTPEFNRVVDSLPQATIKLWNKVKNTLLPTPAKFHYVFNMRELSRIFKGILTVKRDTFMAAKKACGLESEMFLIALWKHECERVFVDKLTNNSDI
jgi:dynein heavy chain